MMLTTPAPTTLRRLVFTSLLGLALVVGCGDDDESPEDDGGAAAGGDGSGAADGEGGGDQTTTTTTTDTTTSSATSSSSSGGGEECCDLFDCSGEVRCDACGTTVSGCNIRGNDACGFCYTEADCDEVCSEN
ncbi:MAG: hypothetical protein AAF928_17050 [Myxococcota bacterium]